MPLRDLSTLLLLATTLLVQCRATDQRSAQELTIKELKVTADELVFRVVNELDRKVTVNGIEDFYIEREEKEGWVFIPYSRCMCGAPCPPPQSKVLMPSEESIVKWGRISRTCRSRMPDNPVPETVEERVPNGRYRMVITLLMTEDGKRLNPVKQYVEFKLK